MKQLRKLGWPACRATQWVAELQSEAVTQCGTTSTAASTCGTAWAVLPQPGVGQVDGCTSSKRAAALQARHSLHNMHGGWRHVQCCIWSWAPCAGARAASARGGTACARACAARAKGCAACARLAQREGWLHSRLAQPAILLTVRLPARDAVGPLSRDRGAVQHAGWVLHLVLGCEGAHMMEHVVKTAAFKRTFPCP